MSDSELAKSFDVVAENYDKYRTGYPQELIEDIFKIAKVEPTYCSALEIGGGSGQATLDFAKTGASILCVEPGASLVDRAKSNLAEFKSVSFVNSTYEKLDTNGKQFNLIYAAQSFHWVDPNVAYNLLKRDLLPHGLFAAFWKRNMPQDTELEKQLNSLFFASLPGYRVFSPQEYEMDILSDLNKLISSGKFYGCQLRRYPCPSEVLSPRESAESLSTWSMVAALSAEKRAALLNEVEAIITKYRDPKASNTQEVTLICGFCCQSEG